MATNFTLSDISLIIPTYNRVNDLRETLNSFKPFWGKLKEILIIDQSTDTLTQKFIASLDIKNIIYIHSATPSLTRARNYGVSKSNKSSRIIGFLDDDVTLSKEYFEGILSVFNGKPDALGVSGWYFPDIQVNRSEQLIKKFFRIEHYERNNASVVSAYGQVYPSQLDRVINAEWVPGFNMFFKRDVFTHFSFDERLEKYALGEDFDFTYRISKRHPRSLFITPYAPLVHRASIVERYPTQRAAEMNQVNHFYINFKNFNKTFNEKLAFFWVLLGILLLRVIRLSITRKKTDMVKLFFFSKTLLYCLIHLRKVRNLTL